MDKRRKKYKKQDVLKAIRESNGLLGNVAKTLGCKVTTVKAIIDKDLDLQEAMSRQISIMEDLAKDTIQQALLDGDLATAKWYLEFQSRAGYRSDIQRIQVSFVEDI